mmetsp:Transcript_85520/g.148237  ORF Transcript_85520/g.148237 Transcript_85520/m.148237 type:complete len:277 (+) Transcript_85520:140-970(+)
MQERSWQMLLVPLLVVLLPEVSGSRQQDSCDNILSPDAVCRCNDSDHSTNHPGDGRCACDLNSSLAAPSPSALLAAHLEVQSSAALPDDAVTAQIQRWAEAFSEEMEQLREELRKRVPLIAASEEDIRGLVKERKKKELTRPPGCPADGHFAGLGCALRESEGDAQAAPFLCKCDGDQYCEATTVCNLDRTDCRRPTLGKESGEWSIDDLFQNHQTSNEEWEKILFGRCMFWSSYSRVRWPAIYTVAAIMFCLVSCICGLLFFLIMKWRQGVPKSC